MMRLPIHAGKARVDTCNDQSGIRNGVSFQHRRNGRGILECRNMNADTFVCFASVGYHFVAELTAGCFMADHGLACRDAEDLIAQIDFSVRKHIECLTDDLYAFDVFQDTDHDSGEDITGVEYRFFKIKLVVAAVRSILAHIDRNSGGSCLRTDSTDTKAVFGR